MGGSGGSGLGGSEAGGRAGSGGNGIAPDAGALFAAVQNIFNSNCVRCHDASLPAVMPETGCCYPQLPLTSNASYDGIVGKPAHEACGGTLVVPGNPDTSYLYHKVNDAQPCYGNRMPAFGQIRVPPLNAQQLATIADWIRAGAPR